jgi:uncharacterized protein
MSSDIRDRLRRLGVHKGAAHIKPPARKATPTHVIDEPAPDTSRSTLHAPRSTANEPLWDLELDTPAGPAYVRRTTYPLDHQHGPTALERSFGYPSHTLARLAGGAALDLRNALFLDTETTGLAGGTGTLVFLVGVGYLVEEYRAQNTEHRTSNFVVDQFFLRDPAEEVALLLALDQLLEERNALVTFNGRGFDLPLLETRFTLSSMPSQLGDKQHLDLLLPARRAWRLDFGSCSLGALEAHVLGVTREQQDIAGFLIPQLYREYLNTGDPADMHRVMYHNLHDVLSMVTLTARLCAALEEPSFVGEHLALAAYYESEGHYERAEAVYRTALKAAAAKSLASQRRVLLLRLVACLKHLDRRADVLPCWQALADDGDVDAWVELAKHFEWHEVDLPRATACAERARALNPDPLTREELDRRLQRLARKSSRQSAAAAPRRPRE